MPTKKWTEEEEEFLRTGFRGLSNAELAEKFDITKNAVQKKLARMGLKRSQAERELPDDNVDEATDTVNEEEREVISTESHFFQGNRLFHEERDYKQAIEEYRQALKEGLSESIELKARYWMAESHVKIGEIKAAMKILNDLVKKHGNTYLGGSAKRRVEVLAEYVGV